MQQNRAAPYLLASMLAVAGVFHLARADVFVRIVPSWLPAPRVLVAVSGVALLCGALGLCLPATRRAAAWGVLVLLAVVFPANVEMLRAAHAGHAPALWQAALVARLPLQLIVGWWVWRSALRRPPAAGYPGRTISRWTIPSSR
jgi:uncharacterized membrane protein